MNINPIGVVLCRIAAIWLAVSGLSGIVPPLIRLIAEREADSFLTYLLLMSAAPLVAAILLWAMAESIASTRVASAMSIESFDTDALLKIGIQLIGIYMAAFGAIGLLQVETVAMLQAGMFDDEEVAKRLVPTTMGQRISAIARIVLGVILIMVGRRGR